MNPIRDGQVRCTKCGERKPVAEMHRDAHTTTGLSSWCQSCVVQAQRRTRAKADLGPDYGVPRQAAPYTLAAFSKFCRGLVLDNRKTRGIRRGPFVVEPFQRQMLAEHFAGATEVVIVLPKKNGKTTLLAALALFHLKAVPGAEVVIGASSRDQAKILFRQAADLVKRSDLLDEYDLRSGIGEIRLAGQRDGPRIRVLAADVNTGDGVIPTLALVDELHRHPSAELYGLFRDGLEGLDGQMVTISTAGTRMASPLGEFRTKAYALPNFQRDPARAYTSASTDDGSFVWHEWCLTDTDDVLDMELVKLANPASWHTVDRLRRRHESPSMTPWRWLRFACGIWTEGEEPWIEPATWDALADDGLAIMPDELVVVDVQMAYKRAAVVIGATRPDGLAVEARIMPAPCSYGEIEDALRDIAGAYKVQQITHGARGFARSAETLEGEGLPMVEFPRTPMRMSEAAGTLYRLVQAGKLHHTGDPELRAQVLAGQAKKTEREWRLVEAEGHAPIDALTSLSVVAQCSGTPEREPMMAWA